ncbi:MAG: GreA/GreB family elongation factor [Caulobacter sp.]|nr:GreA/GreB family elongation factor [Caulobacter sp.]
MPTLTPERSATRARSTIRIHAADYETLSDLIVPTAEPTPGMRLLAAELERATVLDGPSRAEFVRLGSVVDYEDLGSGRVRTVRVSLPREASIDDGSISVLAPIGAALIGLSPGQSFGWRDENGRERAIRVLAVRSHG